MKKKKGTAHEQNELVILVIFKSNATFPSGVECSQTIIQAIINERFRILFMRGVSLCCTAIAGCCSSIIKQHNFWLTFLYPSLCPITSIEVSVADGFCDVHGLYLLRTSKISNGAGHLEDTGVGTSGEFQALHSYAKHFHRSCIGLCELV